MANPVPVSSLDRTARISGLMFLLSLVVPTLGWTQALAKLVVPGNVVETGRNVAAHPLLFRAGILGEILTSIVVLVLASALYRLLESVDRPLASMALHLKLVEGGLWAVIALGHVAALRAVTEQGASAVLSRGEMGAMVGLLLVSHMPLTAVPGVFLGLSLVVFLSLLFRSGYVPRGLAAFGVLSYALVFLYDSLLIASPSCAANVAVQVVGWGPSVLFELVAGPWLLLRGVSAPRASPPEVTA